MLSQSKFCLLGRKSRGCGKHILSFQCGWCRFGRQGLLGSVVHRFGWLWQIWDSKQDFRKDSRGVGWSPGHLSALLHLSRWLKNRAAAEQNLEQIKCMGKELQKIKLVVYSFRCGGSWAWIQIPLCPCLAVWPETEYSTLCRAIVRIKWGEVCWMLGTMLGNKWVHSKH